MRAMFKDMRGWAMRGRVARIKPMGIKAMGIKARWGALGGALVLSASGAVWAQPKPVFTAEMVQTRRAAPSEAAPAPKLESKDVVQVFEKVCVQTRGDADVAADWALSQGWESLGAMRGSTDSLREDRPGAVLAMPGTEGAVFVVLTDAQCTVWAEGMNGPLVRRAFAEMVARVSSKGARAQFINERSVERAGAWRHQAQWRFRPVGATADWSLASITTLIELPSTQVLRMGPMAAEPKQTPDGIPLR